MIKTKKQMFIVIGAFALVMLLGTTTFAFFNYTRTGSANIIKTGRINFNSEQGNAINLTNMFPIDTSVTGIMDDATKVGTVTIHVTGDTTYSEGIEYLVSAVNVQNTTGSTALPISINVSVQNNNESSLGTSDTDYFNNRGTSSQTSIYKVLAGETLRESGRILVGYIKSGQDGVDGNIVIKAYLDKERVAITDTYDGTESDTNGTTNDWVDGRVVLTTEEWNSLKNNGVSFQIKVEANEGIWVSDGSLYSIMKEKSVMDNISSTYVSASTGIDFKQNASDTNGKGVYMRAGTENSAYPVVYYRGMVEDNNVMFADKCWKAVRSTETGGVKLIYNGEINPITTYEHNDILSDTEIDYTNDTTYPFAYNSETKKWSSTNHGNSNATILIHVKEAANYTVHYESTMQDYSSGLLYVNESFITSFSSEKIDSYNLGTLTPSDEIKIIYYGAYSDPGTYGIFFQIEEHYGTPTTIESCDVIANNGIGSGRFNDKTNSIAYGGYMYGDVYELKYKYLNDVYYGSGFTYDGTNYKLTDSSRTRMIGQDYTCGLTVSDGTCEDIMYFIDSEYYMLFKNGEGLEEAIAKMQINNTDSAAKSQIDTWYQNNMTAYTNKLEDTIWCNDRSGMNERYRYAPYTRVNNGTPSLVCQNVNDSFTVDNAIGNQKLDYPVGLLTMDEVLLAGKNFYINIGWTMSPAGLGYTHGDGVNSTVFVGAEYDYYESYYSIRPSISLKPGTTVISGDGTTSNPYVIE